MTIEQDAIDAAYQGVAKAINNGAYINLDARRDISTMRENDTIPKATQTIIEGFQGYVEGVSRP